MQKTKITAQIIDDHGLDQEDYKLIQKILKRDPNLTELGMFSVLWSEHCSYKHSRPLLKNFPTTGKYVLQGPGENAGIIDIGSGLGLAFKIESHNHPSQIEPYQGAATGVGGILRDIFTMGARPVALLNSLRFGLPQKSEKNKMLLSQVVKGIGDYGNCVGVPTVGGETFFDDIYAGNCLVNAMCLGVVQATDQKVHELYGPIIKGLADGVGNPVFYVGSSTGRDGIHGATFASVDLSSQSEEKKSSVQVGDPFTEKLLLEACLEAIKTGAIVGMQDMGAAGLTSSSSEMASRSNNGMELNLDKVPCREANMTAYDMMLSESQERMLMVLQKGREKEVLDIFEKWDLHAVEVGVVTDDGMLRVYHKGVLEAEVPARALAHDAPIVHAKDAVPYYLEEVQNVKIESLPDLEQSEIQNAYLNLLAAPNIVSKKWIYSQYDHMVQTGTIVRPGAGDAAVIRIKGSDTQIAAATDGNGRYSYLDPYRGGVIAVAESARNVVCVGAKPVAVTNNLNFANPEKPEMFWQLKKSCEGIAEACREFDTPVTGGNVSLYNENESGAIFPTPVIGMIGLIEPGVKAIGMKFMNVDDEIILLGNNKNVLGGSEFLSTYHDMVAGLPPELNFEKEKALQSLVLKAIKLGLLNCAHDISLGGLSVALTQMTTDTLGFEVDIKAKSIGLRFDAALFGETQSRIIVSISKDKKHEFLKLAGEYKTPYHELGKVVKEKIQLRLDGESVIESSTQSVRTILEKTLPTLMAGH